MGGGTKLRGSHNGWCKEDSYSTDGCNVVVLPVTVMPDAHSRRSQTLVLTPFVNSFRIAVPFRGQNDLEFELFVLKSGTNCTIYNSSSKKVQTRAAAVHYKHLLKLVSEASSLGRSCIPLTANN